MELSEILDPLSVHEFKQDYLGNNFLRTPGHPAKFGSLLTWPDLNSLLTNHRFGQGQMRLVKQSKDIPIPYLMTATWRDPGGATEVEAILRNGATLVLNRMDTISQPIGTLARCLERALLTEIQVNLYAGFQGDSEGFLLHWDDHDVFILQVAGRKRWRVHEPSFRFPLNKRITYAPPDSPPVWEGDLNQGDALYIPRGWWHVATPCDEPTVHLTVGTRNPTAGDIVRWILTGLEERAELDFMRKDVPRFKDCAAQDQYVAEMERALSAALRRPNIVAAFLKQRDVRALARPAFSLPWSASPAGGMGLETGTIRVIPRHMDVEPVLDPPRVEVSFQGRQISLDGSMEPFIQFLADRTEVSIQDFYDSFQALYSRDVLEQSVLTLVKCGMISVQEDEAEVARETP